MSNSLLTGAGISALAHHAVHGRGMKFQMKAHHMTAAGKLLHKQVGGSAFTDFFTKSIPNFFTKTIPDTAKTVHEKVLKPAAKWISERAKEGYKNFKEKPLQFVGDLVAKTGIPIVKNVGEFTSELGKKVGAGMPKTKLGPKNQGGYGIVDGPIAPVRKWLGSLKGSGAVKKKGKF